MNKAVSIEIQLVLIEKKFLHLTLYFNVIHRLSYFQIYQHTNIIITKVT